MVVDLLFSTPDLLPYDLPAHQYKKPFRVMVANDGFDATRAFECRAFD